jgi:hypothetical protein
LKETVSEGFKPPLRSLFLCALDSSAVVGWSPAPYNISMLAIAFLASALVQPGAPGWTRLFSDASESTYLGLSQSGTAKSERLFWLRHVFPKTRSNNVHSSQDQWQVNCSSGTYMMLAVVQYDRAGKILSAQAVPLAARIPARVEAGSRMEMVFRTVCSQ